MNFREQRLLKIKPHRPRDCENDSPGADPDPEDPYMQLTQSTGYARILGVLSSHCAPLATFSSYKIRFIWWWPSTVSLAGGASSGPPAPLHG